MITYLSHPHQRNFFLSDNQAFFLWGLRHAASRPGARGLLPPGEEREKYYVKEPTENEMDELMVKLETLFKPAMPNEFKPIEPPAARIKSDVHVGDKSIPGRHMYRSSHTPALPPSPKPAAPPR